METIEALEKIGLTAKQGSVYMALLELGTASVEQIAQKAGIKRPTTYLILDELQGLGLVSRVPNVKRTFYQAESPDILAGQIYRKQELLKRFMPQLQAVYNTRKDKPQVQLFEGREGVKQVYKKIFEAGEVWFFGTIQELLKIYPEGLTDFVVQAREKGLKVRDFLTRSAADLKYAAESQRGPNYDLRFLPKDFSYPSDSAIFGDNVVFFSFHPQVFAVMITSREISGSLRTLYELAWRQAEAFSK